jgi:RNA polymerase sigma factor (sigma-70 family)
VVKSARKTDAADDIELVARLDHDPDALDAFYRLHVADVAGFVARRVGDAHAVADIVSNTFLAAIKGAPTFDRRRSPDTARFWLLGIARHQVADYLGANDRQLSIGRRAGANRVLSVDDTARIDELIDAERLAPEIAAALERLSPPVRDAFLLVTVDGIPQTAAASMLGISHAALRARLARARLHLRQQLAAAAPDPPDSPDLTLLPSSLPGGPNGV